MVSGLLGGVCPSADRQTMLPKTSASRESQHAREICLFKNRPHRKEVTADQQHANQRVYTLKPRAAHAPFRSPFRSLFSETPALRAVRLSLFRSEITVERPQTAHLLHARIRTYSMLPDIEN